jgi:hypothetical protein
MIYLLNRDYSRYQPAGTVLQPPFDGERGG